MTMKIVPIALVSSLLAVFLGCGSNEPARFDPPEKDRPESLGSVGQAVADTEDPTAIILAAIDAHGGEANFSKANIGQTRMTINGAFQLGMTGQFSKFDKFVLPGKHKRVVKGQAQGQQLDMTVVINGDKAWMQTDGGEPTPLPVINPNQSVYPADNLGLLLALREPDFQCAVLPADDMKGIPAHCVRVETAGAWVGDLFFDKETNLLVASRKELFDNTIGEKRSIETYYLAYKEVDGLNLPMLMETVMDGETTAKIRVTEVTFMDDIDENVFARPVAQE